MILTTLVLQGLTLKPALALLGLGPDRSEEREENEARLRVAKAGIRRLDHLVRERPELSQAARDLRARHQHRVHRYESRQRDRRHEVDEAYLAAFREARADMLNAERRELVRMRDAGTIGDDVLRKVQRDLDLEQLLVGATDATLDEEDEP